MSFFSWKNVYNYYIYHSKDNIDFLKNLRNIPLTDYEDITVNSESDIMNKDMRESQNQITELTQLYKENKLITVRLGCVESAFFMDKVYKFKMPSHLLIQDSSKIDKYMQENAGLYYKDKVFKDKVLNWWCQETKELLLHTSTTLTSAYCFLNYDICTWALLNMKKTFYNYGNMTDILLQHSEGKRLLYVGNSVGSIQAGYNRGLQKAWKFPVSNFSMYYLKTPQTTIDMKYPHNSMIETCEQLLCELVAQYSDFDTAIFGCGAYASPLINALRKKFPQKNLIYLGSDCFKMFGIYSKMMPYTYFSKAVTENWIEVVEEVPVGCENHPEKRYWK